MLSKHEIIPFPVNASDGDLLKMSEWIWAEQQKVVQLDRSLQIRSGNHGTDTGHRVGVVDLKLGRFLVGLRATRPQQVQKHFQVIQIFASHV